jgi:hypothetical protein
VKINGVDSKYRGGDCLKQSIAFLLNIPLDSVPNFHKFPLSCWKIAFETWVQSKGLSLQETTETPTKPHIAVYRLWDTKKNERLSLHAVVSDGSNILFDINSAKTKKKNKHIEYRSVVRNYVFN